MILNLGCGDQKKGDIRIDINPKKKGVNLIADAQFIPLRNKSVRVVYSKSVLEHLFNPFLSLVEMARVSNHDIIIIVPNLLNLRRVLRSMRDPLSPVNKGTLHLQGWDPIEFKHLVNQIEDLEIIKIEWRSAQKAKARFIRFLNLFFMSHMIVKMRVK